MDDEVTVGIAEEADELPYGGWEHLSTIYQRDTLIDVLTLGADRAQVEAAGIALGERLADAPESLLLHIIATERGGCIRPDDAEEYLRMAEAFEAAEVPPPSPDKG